jgi:hypothetical protein
MNLIQCRPGTLANKRGKEERQGGGVPANSANSIQYRARRKKVLAASPSQQKQCSRSYR